MITVKVKYLKPTNSRCSRLKVYANGFKHQCTYPQNLTGEFAAFFAVKQLVQKYNLTWDTSEMYWGQDDDGTYYFNFKYSKITTEDLV